MVVLVVFVLKTIGGERQDQTLKFYGSVSYL